MPWVSSLASAAVNKTAKILEGLGKPFFSLLVLIIVFLFAILNLPILLIKKVPATPTIPKPFTNKYLHAILIWLLFTIGSTFLTWHFILKDLPEPSLLKTQTLPASTKIYDRTGQQLLYNIYKDINRTPIKLKDIPVHVKLAVLAAEDAEFYNHPGISPTGIVRAVLIYLNTGKKTGGSTITQQLVKNRLLTNEKTIQRKLKEIVLALEVERKYEKDEILEMYLNSAPFGGVEYGIKEAANKYFNKDPQNLSIAESALIAGLPKSPTTLSPFGLTPEKSEKRKNEIIDQMLTQNFITENLAEKAKEEQIQFAQNKIDIKAPHFVMFAKDTLEQTYGTKTIQEGGLNVTTTLDLSIQKLVEETIKSELQNLKNLNVTNAAALVLNTNSGEILALAGSRDYFDQEIDGKVNVALRKRQPGSSIKAVNYAAALSNGLTPATIIDDSPKTFQIKGQPPYTPRNYDGKFRGKITLRSALAESRNVPAVKVLDSIGVEKMFNLGKKMGINSWDNINNYGLSLTLGGGDITLLELAQVYSTIANYGTHKQPNPFIKITNQSGKDLTNKLNIPEPEKILDERVAFMLIDILKDNRARTPAFGPNSSLVIPNHPEIAVKTGTSNNLRDNLTVGFNQDYLVAVWVGNNDNSPMSRVASGVTGASPIWNKIMHSLTKNRKPVAWSPPEGLVRAQVCTTQKSYQEWFLKEKVPQTCNSNFFASQ